MACCACNSVMVPIVGFNQVSCNMMMSACAVTYCEMSCWRAGRLRRPPTLWEMMHVLHSKGRRRPLFMTSRGVFTSVWWTPGAAVLPFSSPCPPCTPTRPSPPHAFPLQTPCPNLPPPLLLPPMHEAWCSFMQFNNTAILPIPLRPPHASHVSLLPCRPSSP
jgi:hypothetical protein